MMTKCLLLALIAANQLASAEPARSASVQSKIEVGALIGPTSSNILTTHSRGSSQPHYGGEGLSAGAFFRYAVLSPIVLESNVVYAQKGYGASDNGLAIRVHYLEAPILVRLDPLRSQSPARLFIFGGVAPALRVGCDASGKIFDNDIHTAVSFDGSCDDDALISHMPSRFDLGAVLGGGIGWSSRYGLFEIQARMVRGLVDVGGGHGGDKTVNLATYVLAGYGWTFGP